MPSRSSNEQCKVRLHVSLFEHLLQNLQEQQMQRTPQYDSLMKAMVTKMDPQLQRKLDVLSEKWNTVKEDAGQWHRL